MGLFSQSDSIWLNSDFVVYAVKLKLTLPPATRGTYLKASPGNQSQVTKPRYKGRSGQVETSNQWGTHTVSLATKECGSRLLGTNSDQGDRLVQISTIG